jgi:hypothetical protein
MDKQHGQEAWTYIIETWTYSIGIQNEHGKWTPMMEKQHGHVAFLFVCFHFHIYVHVLVVYATCPCSMFMQHVMFIQEVLYMQREDIDMKLGKAAWKHGHAAQSIDTKNGHAALACSIFCLCSFPF